MQDYSGVQRWIPGYTTDSGRCGGKPLFSRPYGGNSVVKYIQMSFAPCPVVIVLIPGHMADKLNQPGLMAAISVISIMPGLMAATLLC